MTTTKNLAYIFIFLLVLTLFTFTNIAFADHEASVAGEVIPLADASLGHGENCDDVHYHGDLNGKSDPDPEACGHGIVTILKHDEDDESIIPETETEETDGGPSLWSRFKDKVYTAVDVLAQAVGLPGPKTVEETTDIVVDASESIAESIDTIEDYRESVSEDEDTLGLYDHSTDDLEDGSLAKKFFDWIYGN